MRAQMLAQHRRGASQAFAAVDQVVLDRRQFRDRAGGEAGGDAAAGIDDGEAHAQPDEVQHEFPAGGFDCNLPLDAGRLQQLREHRAMRAAGGRDDQGRVGEILQADAAARGQRVSARHREHLTDAGERFRGEIARRRFQRGDADVGASAADGFDRGDAVGGDQFEPVPTLREVRTDARPQQIEIGAFAGGERDRLRRGLLLQFVLEGLRRGRQLAGQTLHPAPGVGDLDRAPATHVEGTADRGAEFGDLGMQRGLGDVKPHRGTAEIAVFREFGESDQGVEADVAKEIHYPSFR